MKRYDPFTDDAEDRWGPDAFPTRRPNEVFIGIYYNELGSISESLLISSHGIRTNSTTGWSLLLYEDIVDLVQPHREDYDISDHLRVITRHGTVELPVRGGRGKLRDVWVVMRFLRSALSSLQAE